jgi:hypothetical protein
VDVVPPLYPLASLPRAERAGQLSQGEDALTVVSLQLDLPTNGGHPVKSVKSTEEVHHGKNPT